MNREWSCHPRGGRYRARNAPSGAHHAAAADATLSVSQRDHELAGVASHGTVQVLRLRQRDPVAVGQAQVGGGRRLRRAQPESQRSIIGVDSFQEVTGHLDVLSICPEDLNHAAPR